LLLPFSYYYPLFPPKKKSDAEKADIVRAELEQFLAEHGQMPSQHADLPSSRSLYAKLKKLKLLHLLKHDWRRGVCDDTLKFFDLHGRIPRRQNMTTDEQRAEDALAQRWDRLLAQKASLPNKLLNEYHQLFAAAEMEVDDGHLAVCVAVSEFFETTRRLPKRQVGDSDEKRAEDALAQRWDRLMAEKASVSKDLLSHYSTIFGAAEMEVDDAPRAVCIAVHVFFVGTAIAKAGPCRY
jgi:DNA helicase IV